MVLFTSYLGISMKCKAFCRVEGGTVTC
uniref:Uncharacterized protein n=1 Tax=Anguilla anguilla TaxID=7936 RepID=A0A0E9VU09_ANGAN